MGHIGIRYAVVFIQLYVKGMQFIHVKIICVCDQLALQEKIKIINVPGYYYSKEHNSDF